MYLINMDDETPNIKTSTKLEFSDCDTNNSINIKNENIGSDAGDICSNSSNVPSCVKDPSPEHVSKKETTDKIVHHQQRSRKVKNKKISKIPVRRIKLANAAVDIEIATSNGNESTQLVEQPLVERQPIHVEIPGSNSLESMALEGFGNFSDDKNLNTNENCSSKEHGYDDKYNLDVVNSYNPFCNNAVYGTTNSVNSNKIDGENLATDELIEVKDEIDENSCSNSPCSKQTAQNSVEYQENSNGKHKKLCKNNPGQITINPMMSENAITSPAMVDGQVMEYGMELHSLNRPRQALASILEETILEAPEEFREYSQVREVNHNIPNINSNMDKLVHVVDTTSINGGNVNENNKKELVHHDHNNKHPPETGDTSQHTSDKDERNRGSATDIFTINKNSNSNEQEQQFENINNKREGGTVSVGSGGDQCIWNTTTSTESIRNKDLIRAQGDNDHGMVVMNNNQHVGFTTPADCHIPSMNKENNEIKEVPITTMPSGTATVETVATVARCKAEAAEAAVGANELCANRQQQPQSSLLEEASIENGVEQCAQASGCSRVPTATVSCVGLESERATSCVNPSNSSCNTTSFINKEHRSSKKEIQNNSVQVQEEKQLHWQFKNGRLVFETVTSKSGLGEQPPEQEQQEQKEHLIEKHDDQDSADNVLSEQVVASDNSDKELQDVLHSRDLNKRIDDSRSRLKYLEQKLKEAGITDTKSDFTDNHNKNNLEPKNTFSNHKYDANQNILQDKAQLKELIPGDIGNNKVVSETESDDLVEFVNGSNLCQFDVRQIILSDFTPAYYDVYDEFNDHKSDDNDSDGCNEVADCNNLIMRGGIENDTMGADGEEQQRTKQHNPDRDNLKSLLKKPGRSKERKNNNRVVFNENKNEFFDADYIILIREECDYDDEDDDGVCTCNQHEMVRLTCCEPNCSCGGGGVYDSGYDQTPQSPKFAPPIEFVDAVTLSPPEGYKDMELEEQQLLALQQMARRSQQAPVCRECSANHDDEDDDGSQSDTEIVECGECEEQEEKEKTDQSQQTTPTTPPNDCETITMTTVKEHRILHEVPSNSSTGEERKSLVNSNVLAVSKSSNDSPISGILKGGRLWKQQSLDNGGSAKPSDSLQQQQSTSESSITSDEENGTRRSVRFIESNNKRDVCDGAAEDEKQDNDNVVEEDNNMIAEEQQEQEQLAKPKDNCNMSTSPEATEMMLTFKLGNHVLISNNSLKPNSAVRQLFPCTKPLSASSGGKEDESIHQYLVTAESLKAFEEAKRSKLPQIIQSGETDESIKRAIERNTLRRSLIRYEPRAKKNVQKTDNSLVERIKQLTCDVDDQDVTDTAEARASPPGEEARNSPEMNNISVKNNATDKSFSPSSSSTTSSSSSSMSSTYRKITDLFGKREKLPDIQQNNNTDGNKLVQTLPDIGGPHHHHPHHHHHHTDDPHKVSTNDSRRQFLSTLAPLTACVGGGMTNNDDYYYHMNNQMAVAATANIATSHMGERASVASSVGTEYSLEDIDEGLKNGGVEDSKRIAPDVLAGTPSASESGDELAMFVQQDASRIERIKKKYQPDQQSNKDDDDEHDDYGFNRRPSVRGIKPRFGSTTEILQQIQNQLQPPTSSQQSQTARITWPYYSESGLSGVDNKTRNINQQQNQQTYTNIPEDAKTRGYTTAQFRPTSLQDENMYQNCANQRCVSRELYRANINTYSVRMGADYYQSLPRRNSGRPQSPPPLEMSKAYHQTMVYIPYNHIENYQPLHPGQNPYYQMQSNDYVRVSNQNQINKRYVEPIYQQRIPMDESSHYSCLPPPMQPNKQVVRMPMHNGANSHIVTSRSESPLPGQYATARSTQTLPPTSAVACNYYRYRPIVGPLWQGDGTYVTKMNRHSFPATNNVSGTAGSRYQQGDNISLTDTESQSSSQINMSNGYKRQTDFSAQKDSMPNSPTKPRFIERGVPEGAASVSPQDVSANNTNSSMTSPSSPQNPSTQPTQPPNQAKPLFYAMNV